MQAKKTRRTSVDPIMDTDVAAVADFLSANHNDRVPWAQACSKPPWQVDAPNRGFMLRDGQRVVGTLLALYSERMVAGRVERFCNLGSWCVLPEYRSRSLSLLNAVLGQEGYNFTILSPDEGPQEILSFLGFRFLDTTSALVPNLPWPTLPGRIRISADPDMIENRLAGSELKLYRDHRAALATHHLVLLHGDESCHVMYRKFRYKGAPLFAIILHVSNADLFRRALVPLARHLLIHHRLVSTLVELRLVDQRPRMSFAVTNWPKMYRSANLEPRQIDYLYSELTCVPW
ncbi:hypothetical protein Mycch_4612 [Mycolicibacterium chubuense NBB4]|uniref:N-acetyltransferase domain-containing protein n=1 Tax=Mycolicibacterium chubuense (strain NBB4) TaxID=710421 RepID=I4BPV7_MYCCN|nr:hypothetical protein [Mycolicibacterium chubuense]AFM19314.1 hypothetical protein Mycch_4612 [Mycolicibacterium chubuense NBB4]